MYKLALVLRYLRKRKITVFPVAGVAVGVMALVVVLAIMDGFDTDFRKSIRGILPDMSLQFRYVEGYDGDIDEIVSRIEAVPQVRAASAYVGGLALVRVQIPGVDFDGNPTSMVVSEYVTFRGFAWETENRVLDLRPHLKYGEDVFGPQAGEDPSRTVFIVGSRLAGRKYPGLRTKTPDWGNIDKGAAIEVITIPTSFDRKSRILGRAADVVSTGIYEIDAHTLFMPIGAARMLREVPENNMSGVGIALKEYSAENVKAAKRNIESAFRGLVPSGAYLISTWEQERGTLLAAVAMERRIMAVILFFFLVVAGFAISAILIMIVLEKIRDIGILLAMGASARGIAGTFLIYGVTIGLIGAALGLAAGVLFVEKIDLIEELIYRQTGWQPFPPEIYDLQAIPRILDWHTNMYIVLTAVAVSFAASLLPAVRAAWLDPVEAIRYE